MTFEHQILERLDRIEELLQIAVAPVAMPQSHLRHGDEVEAEAALAAIQGKSLREYLKERAKTPRRINRKVAA